MGALGNTKTPQGWQARGASNTACDNANNTPISDILAQHFCCCRGGALCVFCLGWKRLQEELSRRLGAENCLLVEWPEGCKDANDVLVQHGADTLGRCIETAKPLPIVGAFDVASLIGALEQHYAQGMPRGASTGWESIDRHYTVRPGEWTLVTGIPGHGKSEFIDALLINLAACNGWRFGIFSPENQPFALHLAKLSEKYSGKPFNPGPTERMSRGEFDMAATWLDRHFTMILPEEPCIDAILSVAKALVLRKGIRGLVIDPWNEIEHGRTQGQTETEYISIVLSRIRQFARAHGVHVWLVAHPAKLFKEANGKYPVPAILDRVAQGEPLSRVCNSPKMPTRKSFFEWVAKYPMIQAQYEFAIQMRADLYAEETISISDEIVIETKHDGKDVTLDLSASVAAHNRLRVDARKWYASKLAPKKYGEKLDVEVDQRRVVTLINLGGRGPVEGK